MPNLHPNSTNYVHSYEPNTNDLVHAMEYNRKGEPRLRASLDEIDTTQKNRLKVSDFSIELFSTTPYSTEPSVWDRAVVNGATVTFDNDQGGTVIAVTDVLGSKAIVQSKRVMPYIPGRGTEVSFALQYTNEVLGIRRRVGVFDDLNGMFFEQDASGEYFCVIRSSITGSVVERRVPRTEWSGVKFDGLDPAGITADPDAIQLLVIEYDWYGAGQVKFNYIINGYKYTIHTFNHANYISTTYMRTPNLPVRFELENVAGTAGSHEMRKYGVSVIQEGTTSRKGRPGDVINGFGGTSMGPLGIYVPIVAIRIKSDRLSSIVTPTSYQLATSSNALIYSRLLLDPVLTGGEWIPYNGDSFIEYNITATAVTGGSILTQNFIPAGAEGFFNLDTTATWQMGRNNMGTTSQILVLAGAGSGNNNVALGSISWIEQR